MEHVAIMKKSWGFTEKILSGEKKIESRWLIMRSKPWDSIASGDTIYFKNSGEAISLMAKVHKVVQFENLTSAKVKTILEKYGAADGIALSDRPAFFKLFKNKKYCVLAFLKNVQSIKPFTINKNGFGAMAAWITIPSIRSITITKIH